MKYCLLSSTSSTNSRSGLQLKSFFPPYLNKMTRKYPSVIHDKSWFKSLKYKELCLKASTLISYSIKYKGLSFPRRIEIIVSCTSLWQPHLKQCMIVVSWQESHMNIQTTKWLFFCLCYNPKHMEILVCLAQLQIHKYRFFSFKFINEPSGRTGTILNLKSTISWSWENKISYRSHLLRCYQL